MDVLPDFNLGTWTNRYEQGFIAANISNPNQQPIPDVLVPYVFNQEFIRIKVTADFYTSRWKAGCKATQVIPTFLGNEDVIKTHYIPLWKPQILHLPTSPDGYRLRLEFYSWFRDVNMLIHSWNP